MSQGTHLSIDAMGGDEGPRLVVTATLAFLKKHPTVSVTLVGDKPRIQQYLPSSQNPSSLAAVIGRVEIAHVTDCVSMDETASAALRNRTHSSMWHALELVASGRAEACISAGNTGALMAMGRKLLGTVEGVRRPAICKPIPTTLGTSLMLDLGANINCPAKQLLQFAVMGSALAQINGNRRPKVALLNIGSELSKGSEEVVSAAQLLKVHPDIHYVGFIEGHEIYSGKVDVIVCDGLIGNVALKVSEGVARFVFDSLRLTFTANWLNRLIGWLVQPVLHNWRKDFKPSRYNGAALLGLRRTVVKSHGGADIVGFEQALETALDQVLANIPERIHACLVARANN